MQEDEGYDPFDVTANSECWCRDIMGSELTPSAFAP